MRKKRSFSTQLFSFLTAIFVITSCSSDKDGFTEVDGQVPTISLKTDHIQTEIGRRFTISGIIEDMDGIKSIHLVNSDLFLDKTIDLVAIYSDIIYTYNLDYSFTTPRNQEGDTFTIKVTVTDLGGRVTEKDLLVTMDGDFTPPIFTTGPSGTMAVLIKEQTSLSLKFSVTDDKALNRVEVLIPELGINETIPVQGISYSHNQPLNLPSQAGEYRLTLTAYDKFELSTTRSCLISVSDMPDFPRMYLSDVKTAEELNSDLFGIPMLIERTEPFTYKAKYYSEAAGTAVRFVPQKTDFSPICFGVNPNDNLVLTDEPDNSLPIILADKGYYEITFNVISGEYSVQKYQPTDKPLPIGSPLLLDPSRPEFTTPFELGLAGIGLPGAGNWSTSNPLILTQDNENPYLFFAEMYLEAGTNVQFVISPRHNWGWWPEPFYRFENGSYNSGENEYNTLNGGDNMDKVTILTTGKYMFKFDTHLLRSKFYPIN